jgi:hypothetical protein
MRRLRAVVLCSAVVVAVTLATERPAAWGFEAHRYIANRAIDLLPVAIRPFFVKRRAMITEHAIDPDLWRTAGWLEEPPQHFLDMDAFGPAPFDALPRDKDAAIAKFGKDMVQKNGLLPWRVEEMYTKLVRAFSDAGQQRPFARDNIAFLTAVMAHYVGDAHVPFHAVVNYDGQLTNQHGLHSRFESALFERYRDRLKVRPMPITIGKPPREFIFDTLITSASFVEPMLAADREAIGSGEVYDRAYYERFFAKAQPVLERRLSEAIAATAAVVTKAWEEGGKPNLEYGPAPDRKRQPPAAKPTGQNP